MYVFMKLEPVSTRLATQVAQSLKQSLLDQGVPLQNVFIFGSAATNNIHRWSDIDIAVVCDPFLHSKYKERDQFSKMASNIDVRAEVVCLHPNDFENKYFTLAQEVKRHGIAV